MSAIIRKVKIFNYKKFTEFVFEPNKEMNVIIGDNEAGKSTILEAINLVISANIRKVEKIGIDRIISREAVEKFLKGNKKLENLPVVRVELYLDGEFGMEMEGKNNSERVEAYGIRMICSPNEEYEQEIKESIEADLDFFPYDYYTIRFSTFADQGYSGYKKKIRSVFIDSSNLDSDYATADFVKRMYSYYTENNVKERVVHKSKFRQVKDQFTRDNLTELNNRVPECKNYSFGFKGNDINNFCDELTIYDNTIPLDSKGTGTQIFVKTDFALSHSGDNVEVILIEEPENHLSHVKLRMLIEKIRTSNKGQIFITTHSSLISTRLELKNVFVLQGIDNNRPLTLHELSDDTADYFMKTPPASILEFALSDKTILVEGPAEYMLFDKFYHTITGKKIEEDDIQVLDVRGLSFKRYLEIAQITNSRVAVITDNDGDYISHCVNKYEDYEKNDNIQIFYDGDNDKRTFEIVLQNDNKVLCDNLFGEHSVDYMLKNKTESALRLLNTEEAVNVPDYIKRAIEWIKS